MDPLVIPRRALDPQVVVALPQKIQRGRFATKSPTLEPTIALSLEARPSMSSPDRAVSRRKFQIESQPFERERNRLVRELGLSLLRVYASMILTSMLGRRPKLRQS